MSGQESNAVANAAAQVRRMQPRRIAKQQRRQPFTPSTEPAYARSRKPQEGGGSGIRRRAAPGRKPRKTRKFMDDNGGGFVMGEQENDDPLQRHHRWIPARGLRRAPSAIPEGMPQRIWKSYCELNAYVIETSTRGDSPSDAVPDSPRQPLQRPSQVPEPVWYAYHATDDWMFRQSLTEEELLMLPMEDTVDKLWPDAPAGFKYVDEDLLVFEDAAKMAGTAFEYSLERLEEQQQQQQQQQQQPPPPPPQTVTTGSAEWTDEFDIMEF